MTHKKSINCLKIYIIFIFADLLCTAELLLRAALYVIVSGGEAIILQNVLEMWVFTFLFKLLIDKQSAIIYDL